MTYERNLMKQSVLDVLVRAKNANIPLSVASISRQTNIEAYWVIQNLKDLPVIKVQISPARFAYILQ